MALSLLCLALFLGYWLRQSYLTEKKQLSRDVDALLLNTIRSVEDSLFREVLSDTSGVRDAMRQRMVEFRSTRKEMRIESGDTTTFKIAVHRPFRRRVRPPARDEKLRGMIGLYISMQSDDTLTAEGNPSEDFEQLILMNYEGQAQRVSLPRDHKMVFAVYDSMEANDQIYSREYRDIFEDNGAYVAVSDYRWFLLKKIIPQLLTAFLLLLLTGFTFSLLYRNIRRQQLLADTKNDLVANISHELNTPITTAGLALETLRTESRPDKKREYIDIASGELDRLSVLVDKIMLSAVQEGKMPLSFEKLNFYELVEDVVSSLQFKSKEVGAELKLHLSDEPVFVSMDKMQMTGAIHNLIDNAMKYSQPNPIISISVLKQANDILFRIQDNGPGIPKIYQSRVFDQFYRIPSGNIHDVKGYGLGLYYVKKVVNTHAGEITLFSDGKSGTTIEMKFRTASDE